jgi:hypothetical protein
MGLNCAERVTHNIGDLSAVIDGILEKMSYLVAAETRWWCCSGQNNEKSDLEL